MANTRHPPSLIPYLDASRGGFHLQFSLISRDPAILEKTPFPFSVVSDSDPLARLLEAEFVSDAGSRLKKVFVLIQRDQYLLTERDDRWVPDNGKIAESWKKAFSFYAGDNMALSLIILANQMNEQGKLRPLQSLFYCKTRKLFFHPPCPKCGLSLHQCENDDLLSHSGLRSYFASLKRYLYCPSCFSEDKSEFYAYGLDRSDPPTIKDRWTLIKEYGLLPDQSNDQFPCGACSNHQECYGSDQRVLSRICPFGFYPFYLFVFDAMSLKDLREGVKRVLFSKEPIAGPQTGPLETEKDDKAIRRILARISQKWQVEIGGKKEGWKETVVLSPEGLEKESRPSSREEKESEIIPETVILSPPGTGLGLKETGTAGARDHGSSLRKTDESPGGEDFSVQTVILGSEKGLSLAFGEGPAKEFGSQKMALPSGEARTHVAARMKGALSKDDVLSETVILGQGKVHGKKRDGKKS